MLGRRKRVYGSRGRSKSAPVKRAKKTTPRWTKLKSKTTNAIAQTIRTTHTYYEYATINPVVAQAGVYVFAANGLYDPNITGVGHQPAGFDQITQLYHEYLVVGSTIRITYTNADTNNCVNAGVFLCDYSTTSSDYRRYVESGNGKWTQCGRLGESDYIKTLTHSADMAKFSNQDIKNEDNFAGSAASNPADTHYYHVVVWPSDGISDNGDVLINVEINYDVIWRDPALLEVS